MNDISVAKHRGRGALHFEFGPNMEQYVLFAFVNLSNSSAWTETIRKDLKLILADTIMYSHNKILDTM